MADVQTPSDDTIESFAKKFDEFARGLDGDEQVILATMMQAAAGEDDVSGFALTYGRPAAAPLEDEPGYDPLAWTRTVVRRTR